MKLILQAPGLDLAKAKPIADLAQVALVQVGPHAFRCSGVDDSPVLRATVSAASNAAGLDAAFVPDDLKLSNFRLLVTDMDSTLITIECIDEIADMQGLKPKVAAITEAAMRGELDFRDSLIRRVALLKGLEASVLARVFEERLQLSAGVPALLQGLATVNMRTVLVSGGFTYFTDRLKLSLGLDASYANQLEIVEGKLTGRVIGEIIDAEAKRATVLSESAALGVAPTAAIVMGDGANDLKMMSVAGLSVAYRAKPVVQDQADVALNFCGLDGVLNLFL
jgi:phosphoserine phosphatase